MELTVVIAIISILGVLFGSGFLGRVIKRFTRDTTREDFVTIEQYKVLEAEVKQLMEEFRNHQFEMVEMGGDVDTLKREHARLWDRLTVVLDKVQENLGKLESHQAGMAAKLDMLIK